MMRTLKYKLVNESKISEEEAYNLMKVATTLQITAKGQLGALLWRGDWTGWSQQLAAPDKPPRL